MYNQGNVPEPPVIRPKASGSAEIHRLEQENERLLLITEALWTILKEKHGLEDQELFRRMVEIDIRDGSLDGRVAASPPEPCPNCKRTVSKHGIRCMYCGEPLVRNPFAR